MFYFPIINTTWPSWVPYLGGQSFIFFRPVFNIADSAITVGVFYLILFHRRDLFHEDKVTKEDAAAE
jgi:signal peptidase II